MSLRAARLIEDAEIALARQFSDRIIALQDGRLVFDGTPAELTDDVLRMVYKGDSFLKEEARHEN